MNYQITIIDDHPIVAEGISLLLQQIEDTQCNIITNSEMIKEEIEKRTSDLYIIDLSLPGINGFQLIELIRKQHPASKILVYTMHEEPWIIQQLSKYHIQGAISKCAPLSELSIAVRAIQNREKYFSTAFSALNHEKHMDQSLKKNVPELSKREKEVLHHITLGESTNEIAEQLFLSTNTIHTYRKRLMAKLEVKNMAELVYKGKDFFR